LLESNSTRQEDVYFLSTAGLQVEGKGLNKRLALSYAGTGQNYTKHGSLDDFENRFRLSSDLTLDQLTASLDASVAQLISPSDPQFSGTIRRWTGGGNLNLGWTQNEWLGFQVIGSWQFIDFSQDQLNFFDQVGWGASGFVSLTPGLPIALLVGGGYRELRYPHEDATQPDIGLGNASVGVDVKIFARLEGGVRVGFERGWILKHRSAPEGAPTPNGGLVVGQIRWQPKLSDMHETSIVLGGQHQATFSATAVFQKNTTVSLTVSQGFPYGFEFFASGAYEEQRPRGGVTLRSPSAHAGLSWSPLPQLELAVQGSYVSRSSTGSGFEVVTVGGGVTVGF
jgi:hypothetical protein